MMSSLVNELKFNEKGLIPAVIQDYKTDEVLTLCYMNDEAFRKSVDEGKVYVFRRSKNKLMLKGEISGHIQIIKEIYVDCEGNSLLIKVEQKTAACHTGYFTCYYRKLKKDGTVEISKKKVFDPGKVY